MREFTRIEKDRIEFLDSRFYQSAKTGQFLPSSTTILDAYPKPYAFYEWVKKMGEDADEYRDEQGRKGSAVHNLCEEYDNRLECNMVTEFGNPIYKQIEWAMFERYIEFRDRFKDYTLIANEVHYASDTLGYGGTLDRVFERPILKLGIQTKGKVVTTDVKERILVDIKTGNGLYNHMWLQMASYVQLWNEFNPKLPIDNIAILWLKASTRTDGKTGDVQGKGWQLRFPDKPIKYYWDLFRAVKAVWTEEYGDLKPKNMSYAIKHKLK
jgi:hypothetical protein